MAKLADKYGIPKLKEMAIAQFKRLALEETDITDILYILGKLKDTESHRDSDHAIFVQKNLRGISNALEAKHRDKLLQEPHFVALGDDKLQMKRALQGMRGFWYRTCMNCYVERVTDEKEEDRACCGNEHPLWERCWFKDRNVDLTAA